MSRIEQEIRTSKHTYRVSFDDSFKQKGQGVPHDTEVFAIDGAPISEEESIEAICRIDKDEFQEFLEAINDSL